MIHPLATFTTNHPRSVLVLLAFLTLAAALAIPNVRADFTPSDLFASFEGQQELEDEVRATFGAVDNVVLVLVSASDVLDPEVLQWIHHRSTELSSIDGVERIDSVTVTQIPRVVAAIDTQSPAAADTVLAALFRAYSSFWAFGDRGSASPAARNIDGAPATDSPDATTVRTGPVVRSTTVTSEEVQELRLALEDAPLLRGRLINADGTLTAIAVTMRRDITRAAEINAIVGEIERGISSAAAPDGLDVSLSGLPYVRNVVVERMRADQSIMLPAAIIMCILILLLAFRWWPALLLPTGAVAMSAVWLVGGMAIVREPFNIINNIIPMMVIIIGISNAIHVLSRYGEELQRHPDRRVASREAMKAMMIACFLTSFTTAVGFASLAVSRTEILGRFGVTAAIGVMIAYVITISFIPAALTMMPKPGARALVTRPGRLEATVAAIARGVASRRWPIITLAHVILVIGLSSAWSLRIDSAVLDQFDPDDEIHRTMRLVESELGGLRPLDIVIRTDDPARWSDPELAHAIDAIVEWSLEQDGVLSGESYLALLREARFMLARSSSARERGFDDSDELARLLQLVASADEAGPMLGYLAADRLRGRVQLRIEDMGAQATIALAERLSVELDSQLGGISGVSWELAGDAWTGSRGLDVVIRDLMTSLALAFVIIFGFLAFLLRSVRLGLISVLPNILPLVLTMTWMAARGIQLNTATAIIFSISIGLAVDGTIHMLVRFREERGRGLSVDEAIDQSARGTGRAIVLTCVSLVLGFGIMMLSAFVPVQRFGELIAVTVTGVLLSTLLVLPALIRAFAGDAGARQSPKSQDR